MNDPAKVGTMQGLMQANHNLQQYLRSNFLRVVLQEIGQRTQPNLFFFRVLGFGGRISLQHNASPLQPRIIDPVLPLHDSKFVNWPDTGPLHLFECLAFLKKIIFKPFTFGNLSVN